MSDTFEGAHSYLLVFLDRIEELRDYLDHAPVESLPKSLRNMLEATRHLNNDPRLAIEKMREGMIQGAQHDPEAVFLAGMMSAHVNDVDGALQQLSEAVRDGFSPVQTLETSPALARIREKPEFETVLDAARQRRRIALAIFERGDGPRLLGISSEQA